MQAEKCLEVFLDDINFLVLLVSVISLNLPGTFFVEKHSQVQVVIFDSDFVVHCRKSWRRAYFTLLVFSLRHFLAYKSKAS